MGTNILSLPPPPTTTTTIITTTTTTTFGQLSHSHPLTFIDKLVSAVEETGGGVCKVRVETDDDGAVEGDSEARRDSTAVPPSERRVEQVLLRRVLDFRVDVQILMIAPIGEMQVVME